MKKLAFVFAFTLGLFSTALAEEDTRTALEGARAFITEEMRPILNQKSEKVYGLRRTASYMEGHVPGAVSAVRHRNGKDKTLDVAVPDPDQGTTVVLYSHGVAGWRSYRAARAAIASGYRDVPWPRGGYAEWEDKNFPVGG